MRFLLPLLAVIAGVVFLASHGSDRRSGGVLGEQLCDAISCGDINLASRLFQDGAPINHISKITGESVLMEAVVTGNEQLVQWALQHGADVNWRNGAGFTPLMFAASRREDLAIANDLLQAGAVVDNSSERGVTALMMAAQRGDAPMVRLFVNAGASLSVTFRDGRVSLITSDDAECRRILGSRRMVAVGHPAPGECQPASYR